MTTTPSRTPTAAEGGAGPAPARLLAGIAAGLSPLLFALAVLVVPYDTNDSSKDMVSTIAAHQGTTELSLWLWLLGTILLAPGLVAVGLLATARSAKLGLWGAVLFGTGLLAITATPSTDIVALGGLDKGIGQDTLVKITDGVNELALVNAPILYFVAAHVIGAILLGVALLRGRVVPPWAAWLLIVSMPLNVVGFVGGLMPLTVLSFVLLAVPLGYAGLGVARHGTGWVRAA